MMTTPSIFLSLFFIANFIIDVIFNAHLMSLKHLLFFMVIFCTNILRIHHDSKKQFYQLTVISVVVIFILGVILGHISLSLFNIGFVISMYAFGVWEYPDNILPLVTWRVLNGISYDFFPLFYHISSISKFSFHPMLTTLAIYSSEFKYVTNILTSGFAAIAISMYILHVSLFIISSNINKYNKAIGNRTHLVYILIGSCVIIGIKSFIIYPNIMGYILLGLHFTAFGYVIYGSYHVLLEGLHAAMNMFSDYLRELGIIYFSANYLGILSQNFILQIVMYLGVVLGLYSSYKNK